MSQINIKLPQELVTALNSYTGQVGIARPILLTELISDYLSAGLEESTAIVAAELKASLSQDQQKRKLKEVIIDHVSEEVVKKLKTWAENLGVTLSLLMEIIIRNRFSDQARLQAIVDQIRAKGYQAQLEIPETDTSEAARVTVVALLSPELRAEIQRVEELESRRTAQQIEHFVTVAVERQDEFDKPLSKPSPPGSERKLFRVPRSVHELLSAWSKRKKRTLQNHIVHILQKSVEKSPTPPSP
jgi:macrodomain Ter protein organizer (MatP/YcbG family)